MITTPKGLRPCIATEKSLLFNYLFVRVWPLVSLRSFNHFNRKSARAEIAYKKKPEVHAWRYPTAKWQEITSTKMLKYNSTMHVVLLFHIYIPFDSLQKQFIFPIPLPSFFNDFLIATRKTADRSRCWVREHNSTASVRPTCPCLKQRLARFEFDVNAIPFALCDD